MAQASDPMVACRNLGKSFGDLQVLKDINIEIAEGERVTFIGPSGSGKSTLLRLIMTLEEPNHGEVLIRGKHLWDKNGNKAPAKPEELRRLRRNLGMVFQHFNLFPHMTALENLIEAPIRVVGMDQEKARDHGLKLLDKVGLGDKADAYPAKLSGGQKQRVAIARALAMEPEVMLFDEVTSALDPETVGEVVGVLLDLAKESSMTMLIVTHQLNFAQAISDRIVFMEGGVVVESGPPEELFKNPQEQRTKEFLDSVLEFR